MVKIVILLDDSMNFADDFMIMDKEKSSIISVSTYLYVLQTKAVQI